jgi:hypothetical protein
MLPDGRALPLLAESPMKKPGTCGSPVPELRIQGWNPTPPLSPLCHPSS